MSHKKSSLYFFLQLSLYYFLVSHKQHINEKAYQRIWNKYIYLHENIIIPLLCQCGCVGQIKNSENSEFFFRDFSIRVFDFDWWSKIRNKKTRNNISEIFEISDVSEFSICHFFIFFLNFFFFFRNVFSGSLFYICNYPVLHFINIVRLSDWRKMISCVYVLIYKIYSQ